MAVISTLSVSLTANTKGLLKGLKTAKKRVQAFSASLINAKTAIIGALGIGSFSLLLNRSMSAFRQQEQAIASLKAANESMGRSALGLTEQLIAQASDIQNQGIIGDEDLIKGQSMLSTFATIPDELLPRATAAMADLMAKSDMSAFAAAKLIGKASMGQVGALSIAGIGLSDATIKAAKAKKEIDALGASLGLNLGDIGEQGKILKLILSDIESQVGGANLALAKTNTGALDQLYNGLGDLEEIAGEVVTHAVADWARLGAIAVSELDINAANLGEKLKIVMLGAAESVGPFLTALKGIQLVWKSIEIGLAGFELMARGVFAGLIRPLNAISDVFGFDFGGDAMRALDTAFDNQLVNVDKLKQEWATIYDDIASRKINNQVKDAIQSFDDKARKANSDFQKLTPKDYSPNVAPQSKRALSALENDASLLIQQQQLNGIQETNQILRALSGARAQ